MDAVTDLGSGVGDILRPESLIDRFPVDSSVVGSEGTRGRDGDEDPTGVTGIKKNGVQAHPAGTWLPARTGAVSAEPGKFRPRLSAIHCAEQGGVFHPGVHGVGIAQRRFKMPDPLEFPGVLRAVVPLVSAWNAIVYKRVADRLP